MTEGTRPTRRQLVTSMGIALCSMASVCHATTEGLPQTMQEKPATAANRSRTSLHEDIEIKVRPSAHL